MSRQFTSVLGILASLSLWVMAGCVVPTPRVAPPSGIYQCPQTINLDDSMPGATLFYTEDGNPPTRESKKYAGPFVSGAAQVQAVAESSNGKMSKVSAASYTCALTRGEFAVLLQQRFSLPPPKQPTSFSDLSPSNPVTAAAEAAASYMNPQVLCPTCALSKNFFPNQPVTRATSTIALVRVLVARGQMQLLAPAEADKVLSGSPDAKKLPSPGARRYFATAIAHNLIALSPTHELQPARLHSRPEVEARIAQIHKEFKVEDKPPQ